MRLVGLQIEGDPRARAGRPTQSADLRALPRVVPPWTPPAPGTAVLVLPLRSRGGAHACRSVAGAGYRVIAAHVSDDLDLRTRYADLRLRCPSPTSEPGRFAEWVAQTCAREGVKAVLPLDEECVKALLDTPLDGVAVSGPTAWQYARLGDKGGLGATAFEAGVDHPVSAVVDRDGRHAAFPALPSVIKSRLSEPGAIGGEIVVVETPAERERVIARMVAAVGAVVVQELVEGQSWRVHFVRSPGGTAAVCGRTTRQWPPRTGMSSTQDFGDPDPRVMAAAARLLDSVDYVGSGSVQFIEHGERMVVHDVNLRPPTSMAGAMAAGLDLPRLAVEVALGRPTLDPVEHRPARYVWLSAEVRSLALALAGSADAGRPGPIARDLAYALVSRHGVLDPSSLRDPLPVAGALAEIGRWAADRARRKLPRRGGRSTLA